MFTCQACNQNTKPGEKATKIILEMRNRSYFNPYSETRKNSVGTEIVKEVSVGPCCIDTKGVFSPIESYHAAKLFADSPANPVNFK